MSATIICKKSNDKTTKAFGMVKRGLMNKALEQLTSVGFRLWIILSINSDGFKYTIDHDYMDSAIDELERTCYLLHNADGTYTFFEDNGMNPEFERLFEPWPSVYTKYEVSSKTDEGTCSGYLRKKLNEAGMPYKHNDFLKYWRSKYTELIKHRKIKKLDIDDPFCYDLGVALSWYLWDNFDFSVGDNIPVVSVKSFDDEMTRIINAYKNKGEASIPVTEKSIEYLQNAWRSKKLHLPANIIGQIIDERKS